MAQNPYNDPFYFMLPPGSTLGAVGKAAAHVERKFNLRGRLETVRTDSEGTLCRLVDCQHGSTR